MNKPDLTLFVGEALVGNEAVDQLVRFNQVSSLFTEIEYIEVYGVISKM